MKKQKLAVMVVSSVLLSGMMTGCVSSADAIEEGSNPSIVKTQKQEIVYQTKEDRQVSPEREALELLVPEDLEGMIIQEDEALLDYAVPPTIETVTSLSSDIVRGQVQGIEYTSLGGTAWTILTVSVNETWKGTVDPGRLIDVYCFGGYVPMRTAGDEANIWVHGKGDLTEEQIDRTVIHTTWEGQNQAEVGDTFVFCLRVADPKTDMPPDGYECVMGAFGQFETDEMGSLTRQAKMSEEEAYFSKSEFLEIVS